VSGNKIHHNFVIVGGGTAGWITANILAHTCDDVEITLIEDPSIPTIGVGEGSTPALKSFFELLGIPEIRWMSECDATYKVGIQFDDWSNVDEEDYFHPFPSIIDNHTLPAFFYNARLRASGKDVTANPSAYFLAAKLAEEHRAPVEKEAFPFEINYAYHFDSNKLGKVLREHALSLGVIWKKDTVNEVNVAQSGHIDTIRTASGQVFRADMFFDCTGFESLLLRKALKVEFKDFTEMLINDSAAVVQTAATSLHRESKTLSKALKSGWKWRIPLASRTGHGYVYSKNFTSTSEVESELLSSMSYDDKVQITDIRHLSFVTGRVCSHWKENCLGVGLSQGFIEPLEATALFLVQQTAAKFADLWRSGQRTKSAQTQFNSQINNLFDGIRDYVVLHYRLSKRSDTDYWNAAREDIKVPERIRELLNQWERGADIIPFLRSNGLDQFYPVASWYAILSGHKHFPVQLDSFEEKLSRFPPGKVQTFIKRCTLNYPTHSQALARLP